MTTEQKDRRVRGSELLRLRLEKLAMEAKSISRMVPANLPELEAAGGKIGIFCNSGADEHVMVRQAIRLRRRRDALFPDGLFADPAWDLLLDLYLAHLNGTSISVTSACIAACVPPTTALRWISKLEKARLVERSSDVLDQRRIYLHLTDAAVESMRKWIVEASGGVRDGMEQ